MAIPGVSITISGPIGAEYLVFATSSVACSSGATDMYLRLTLDSNTVIGNSVTNSTGGSAWVALTSIGRFSATSSSHTLTLYTGGGLAGNYRVLGSGTRLVAIRVA